MTIRFKVKPLYVHEGSTRFGKWFLRRFQEKILDSISSKKDSLLVAPTGSGKTLSLLLGEQGFVGIYPNNTLLLDQQRSIHKILVEALGAKIVYSSRLREDVGVLRVYEIPSTINGEPPILGYKKVAVAILSGKYVGYDYDENGGLMPKRAIVLRNIVEKICWPSKGESMPYIITLATPDTALMIMTGIYRNFERVGYSLHDFLLAAADGCIDVEYLLSRYKVALVDELGDISSIGQCLLKYPWFIDEFHLYRTYEAYSLLPVLKVYRDYAGWEEPFILSSATPKGTLYDIVVEKYKPAKIEEAGKNRGDNTTLVRGETEVEVEPIHVLGRGVSKWFSVGYAVDDVVSKRIDEIKTVISKKGRVFIVVDRVNQVPSIVDTLLTHGVKPECSVTIKPTNCSDKEELVLVGSESISQGIDRSNVRYGIITAYNWANLLQRFGRIGRKTSSKVVIVVPVLRRGVPLEELDNLAVDYSKFAETVEEDFPDIDLQRMYETEDYRELLEKRSTLLEYASTIAFAKVSGTSEVLKTLAKNARSVSAKLLGLFYGPPETITRILTFRSTGFPVLVKKPSGEIEESDIATVLRNYGVENAHVIDVDSGHIHKKMVLLEINLEPDRLRLVLKRDPARQRHARPDVAEFLTGKITTIGELINLGYRLVIKSWDAGESEIEVPLTADVREQPILLLRLPEELVKAYSYSVRGVEVIVGGHSTIGIFI